MEGGLAPAAHAKHCADNVPDFIDLATVRACLRHRLPPSGAYVGKAEHQHRLTGSEFTVQALVLQMVSAVPAVKQHAVKNKPMQRKVQSRLLHRLLLSRAHVAGLSASIWRQGSACGRQNAMRHHFSFEIAYSALASSTPATTSATKLSNLQTQRTLIPGWNDCLGGHREASVSLQSKQALLLLQCLLLTACVEKSMRLACMLRNVPVLHSTALYPSTGYLQGQSATRGAHHQSAALRACITEDSRMATESTATAPDVTASFRSDSDRSCSCAARETQV